MKYKLVQGGSVDEDGYFLRNLDYQPDDLLFIKGNDNFVFGIDEYKRNYYRISVDHLQGILGTELKSIRFEVTADHKLNIHMRYKQYDHNETVSTMDLGDSTYEITGLGDNVASLSQTYGKGL